MIAINLLNWREKRMFVQNNRFFFMVGLVSAVCAALIFLINIYINGKITELQSNVSYLTGEIMGVQKKIEQIKDLQTQKDLLLDRRGVVETLQASRSFEVKIFDNLSRVVPGGVVLNEMTRKDSLLTMSGTADNNGEVSALMKNIARLRWVKDAKLTELKNVEEKKADTKKEAANKITKNAPEDSRVEFRLEITMDPEGGVVK